MLEQQADTMARPPLSVVMIKNDTFVYWHADLKEKQPACHLLHIKES